MDSRVVRNSRIIKGFREWRASSAGFDVFWDSWQSRLVEIYNRESLRNKDRCIIVGIGVRELQGKFYMARYLDLHGLTPLEVLARCAS